MLHAVHVDNVQGEMVLVDQGEEEEEEVLLITEITGVELSR